MRDSVVIVGGGMMGCGISTVAATAGNPIIVVETNDAVRERGPARYEALVDKLLENELITEEQARFAKRNAVFTGDLEFACSRANFVIEAIVEKLELKQELFKKLDELVPPEIMITSNTSGLRITEIGKYVDNKARIATTHFWYPAHLVPLVEVVMGDNGTTIENAEFIRDTLKAWGKSPVIVRRDLPGQLANRLFQAILREAISIVEMGLATPEDVDTAVKAGMGIRFPVWGPLEHTDAVGVELVQSTQDHILPSICNATCAADLMNKKVTDGDLGVKTGKGFYDWNKKDIKALEQLRDDFIINSVKYIRNHN